MSKAASTGSVRRMTGMSLMAAIIAVLTVLGNFVRFGPFPITLALAPIIIGAAMYGAGAGAILGGVFGLVTLISGLAGWDGGAVMYLMGIAPFACILLCIVKAVAAGWCAGLVYGAIEKKNRHVAVIAAGIVCPVVNTGIFIIGMLLFFTSALESWASGQGLMYYIIFGLTGVNFLVELGVNLVLSSGITSIIKYAKGRKRE